MVLDKRIIQHNDSSTGRRLHVAWHDVLGMPTEAVATDDNGEVIHFTVDYGYFESGPVHLGGDPHLGLRIDPRCNELLSEIDSIPNPFAPDLASATGNEYD